MTDALAAWRALQGRSAAGTKQGDQPDVPVTGAPSDIGRVEAPLPVVCQALNDVVLRQCIPGCEMIERLSGQEIKATVTLKIGPTKVSFTGIVRRSDPDPANGYTITGEGVAGVAKGSAALRLVFDGEATMNARLVVAGQPASPKWKTFLVAWIAVYPLLLLIIYTLGALVPNLWRPVQLAISSLLLTSSLIWLIMQRLTSLLRPWLLRGVKRADNRSP